MCLEGRSEEAPLRFHPAITVVGGLDEDARGRLRDVLLALPAGSDPGWPGLVEAHGVILDLNRDTLRLLGLQREVDVVVRPDDLPRDGDAAARDDADLDPRSPGTASAQDRLVELHMSHDILAHGVAALKRGRIEYEEARLQAVEAIEEARADLDPFATTAFEQAAAGLRRAEDAGPDEPPEPVVSESVEALEAERDDLQAKLAATDGVDLAPVIDALHQAERAMARADGLDPLAVRTLAEALREVEDALQELDDRRRKEGRDPADLIRRIEGARIQLERLEASSLPPQLDPADMAELEDVHDAVVEASSKVSSSRLGGKAARQRLDEVVAAEQAVLARIGVPTYSAFSLARSAPGPDPETRVELETTRRELRGLEQAYEDALAADGQEPERAVLERHREQLRRDAAAIIDVATEDLLPAMERLADELSSTDERRQATSELRARLTEVGVDFGDLDLADDEVIDVARVWVADMIALTNERQTLEHELDTVQARLLVVAPVLAAAAAGTAFDPLTRAQLEVEAAEARLARHRQASDRVAELCGLLEEIEERLSDVGDNISAQEALVAAATHGLSTTEELLASSPDAVAPESSIDELLSVVPDGVDGTEWYLLTRLAGLRSVSYAGSVPLVLDGALGGMDRESAHRVLDKVEQMTDVVQVIYLGDDDAVVEWAALRGDGASVISVS